MGIKPGTDCIKRLRRVGEAFFSIYISSVSIKASKGITLTLEKGVVFEGELIVCRNVSNSQSPHRNIYYLCGLI